MDPSESTEAPAWVALLRGVNVSGANKVPMAELRARAEALGWLDVQSYIASGNLVFRAGGTAEGLAAALRAELAAGFAVDVPVLVLPGAALGAALAECPFDPEEGRQVHAYFCWTQPVIDEDALEELRAPNEALEARGRTVWLLAPDGIGRSRLAERLHKVITGTDVTARNLNTVRRLAAMLDAG